MPLPIFYLLILFQIDVHAIAVRIVRDAISESLSDFLLKSQVPVEALWSLRSIDLRVIAFHPSFVNLRMPQNASLVPLISEPIRVDVFSFVIHKRGNSQYPEQEEGDPVSFSAVNGICNVCCFAV